MIGSTATASPDDAAVPGPSRAILWACLGIILAAYLFHVEIYSRYVNDDAFITFRYSRFLAMGRGPYFNSEEHVEGYSNFLLMLIVSPAIAWGGPDAAFPAAKAIGVVCGMLTLLVTFSLVRHLSRSCGMRDTSGIPGIVAAGTLALSPSFAVNSTSGLETTLFAFGITFGTLLGIAGGASGKWLGAGLAFAAAALTRPEGGIVFAFYALGQALRMTAVAWRVPVERKTVSSIWQTVSIRPLAIDAGIVAATLMVHFLIRVTVYDGEWLPNTYFAKQGGYWKIDAWRYVADGLSFPFFGWAGLLAAVLGWVVSRFDLAMAVPVFAVGTGGVLLPFVSGTDWMIGDRLIVPYLPVVATLVAIGWWRLVSVLPGKKGTVSLPVVLLCFVALWAWHRSDRSFFSEYVNRRATGYATGHRALANWLCSEAARPGDTIALMDIGIVGYICIDQRILDLTGLTDRVIAKNPGPFLQKKYSPDYVLNQRPESIVLALGAPDNFNGQMNFNFWTPTEGALFNDPQFQRWYRQPPEGTADATSWVDRFASSLGAARIFVHDQPERPMILAVFRRKVPSTS